MLRYHGSYQSFGSPVLLCFYFVLHMFCVNRNLSALLFETGGEIMIRIILTAALSIAAGSACGRAD